MNSISIAQIEALTDDELNNVRCYLDFETRYRQIPQQPDKSNEQIVTLWCDGCHEYVDEFTVDYLLPRDEAWVCCEVCHNGLIHFGTEAR